MKTSNLLIAIIVGFLTSSIYSQETIWLDENLKETTQYKADYYKIGSEFKGEVSYFYKNKNIYRKLFSVDGKIEGKFSEYYKSGELKETGKYRNGVRVGNWKEYYKTGKIKKRGRYNDGDKVGIWKVFYKNN